METNFNRDLPENQTEDFQNERRKEFKRLMQLSILTRKRERKAIADGMGCSQASLSEWLDEGKRSCMPAHWLDSWTREVNHLILAQIAKENGFILVREEGSSAPVADGAQLLALIAMHHGKLMALCIQAREDGVIDEDERRAIYPEFTRLINELEAEREHFRPGATDGRAIS